MNKYIQFTLISALLSCQLSLAGGAEESLVLFPEKSNRPEKVLLPFRYHPVKPTESTGIVYQGGAMLLTPESKEDYLVLSPLRPCIGIIVSNTQNNRHLAIHLHWSNDLTSIGELYKKLEVNDPKDVKIQLYSAASDPNTFRTIYPSQGRTQKEEISFIKAQLIERLGIPKEQVKAHFWSDTQDPRRLGHYTYSIATTLVNKNGEMFSTCLHAEDILKLSGQSFKKRSLYIPAVVADLEKTNPKELDEEVPYNQLLIQSRRHMIDVAFEKEQSLMIRLAYKLGPQNRVPWKSAMDYRKHPIYFIPEVGKSKSAGLISQPQTVSNSSPSAACSSNEEQSVVAPLMKAEEEITDKLKRSHF